MKNIAFLSAFLLTPMLVFAQVRNVYDLGNTVIGIINDVLVPLVFAIAFIVFIWGVFQYFIQGGHDEEAKEKGKSLMLYGLIGFFLMVSVWGLVNILVNSFELNQNIPRPPATPGVR